MNDGYDDWEGNYLDVGWAFIESVNYFTIRQNY